MKGTQKEREGEGRESRVLSVHICQWWFVEEKGEGRLDVCTVLQYRGNVSTPYR